ncbi:MAG: hypothetical protein ACJAWL_002806, partial [Motiliproteus sp.]
TAGGGAITDSASISVVGDAILNAGANAITLGGTDKTTDFGSLALTGGTVSINEDSATELANVSATRLTLTSTGPITDSGDINVTGAAILNAGANAITLGDADETTNFGSLALTGGDITINEDSATELAGVSANSLTLTSAGPITDSGDINVTGAAILNAGANAMTLGGTSVTTDFDSLDVTGSTVSITEDSDMDVRGAKANSLTLVSEAGNITLSDDGILEVKNSLTLKAAGSIGSQTADINLVFPDSIDLILEATTLNLSTETLAWIQSTKNEDVKGQIVSSSSRSAVETALQEFLIYLFSVDAALFNELVSIFSVSGEGIVLPEDQRDDELIFLLQEGRPVGRVKAMGRLVANFKIWQRYGKLFSLSATVNPGASKASQGNRTSSKLPPSSVSG